MKLFLQSFHRSSRIRAPQLRMRKNFSIIAAFSAPEALSSAHIELPALTLNKSEIDKIATLARLRVSSADADEVAARIGEILALIDQMQAIDTEGVKPLAHPLDAVQRLRADEVTEDDRRDELLALAPSSRNGLFLVPKVIE